MNKTIKAKLNIRSKKQLETLKLMAGSYRAMFNFAVNAQEYCIHYEANKLYNHIIPVEKLEKFLKDRKAQLFPYAMDLDAGLLPAAVAHAHSSFTRWWANYNSDSKYRTPKYLSKREFPKFKTNGRVKVFYDHVTLPKLGELKFYEKSCIPQGAKYSNVTISYDGSHWWISLQVEPKEEPKKEKLSGVSYVDVTNSGDLVVDGKVIESVTGTSAYKKEEAKLSKLTKKLRRQKSQNLVKEAKYNRNVVRTSKGILRTKAKIAKVLDRMSNLRKDQFRKVANAVAITKPKKLLALSKEALGRERQGGLTLEMRRKHTLDFLNVLQRKLESIGSKVVCHKSIVRFRTAAGLAV